MCRLERGAKEGALEQVRWRSRGGLATLPDAGVGGKESLVPWGSPFTAIGRSGRRTRRLCCWPLHPKPACPAQGPSGVSYATPSFFARVEIRNKDFVRLPYDFDLRCRLSTRKLC